VWYQSKKRKLKLAATDQNYHNDIFENIVYRKILMRRP